MVTAVAVLLAIAILFIGVLVVVVVMTLFSIRSGAVLHQMTRCCYCGGCRYHGCHFGRDRRWRDCCGGRG